ncbi:ABC transporter ATP-binding protein [Desertihabitans aurantiacus]|uniref:ABC transporter ATP-binding protein n=1 Tax=Desertihabitans aurantiacus TaxID=2282477 RepID=UPI000DF80CD0|nr:ABC transporter ATP-binding protein [Desertihabitans aurantiacus]
MNALEVRGLGHQFDDLPVLRDVDLGVLPGEIHALIGFNGAGKSTLMRAALGMLRPRAGAVHLFGVRVGDADAAVWERVGHLIDTPFVYPELTVRENLWAAARLHGVPISEVSAAVDHVIAELELAPRASRRASTLSLGNRQRVGLASALVHRPRLLVLDEPTNALDPSGVVLLRGLLLDAVRAGAAALISSHHLDEVARIADRVTVIHAGAIVGELDPHGVDLERAFFAMVHAADRAARSPAATTTEDEVR